LGALLSWNYAGLKAWLQSLTQLRGSEMAQISQETFAAAFAQSKNRQEQAADSEEPSSICAIAGQLAPNILDDSG
jgi:hypothetical protein